MNLGSKNVANVTSGVVRSNLFPSFLGTSAASGLLVILALF